MDQNVLTVHIFLSEIYHEFAFDKGIDVKEQVNRIIADLKFNLVLVKNVDHNPKNL